MAAVPIVRSSRPHLAPATRRPPGCREDSVGAGKLLAPSAGGAVSRAAPAIG